MRRLVIRAKRWAAAGAALLLAITASPAATSASAQQPIVLQDADVARLLPFIGALHQETERRRESVDAMLGDVAAAERFHADVQAGRVDLEAVLRRHSAHASAPPGARYDAACSRSTVLPGSSAGLRGLFMLAYELPSSGGPDGATTRAVAYYRGRGFSPATRDGAATWLAWPDLRADSLAVGVGRVFRADDGSPGCRHLVGRPVVVLRLPSFAITMRAQAAAPAVGRSAAARERAQARAGATPQQLDEMLGAAMIARADAADGEALEQLATLAAQVAEMRPQADARRRNVAWYRRHREALEPALGRAVDQLPR